MKYLSAIIMSVFLLTGCVNITPGGSSESTDSSKALMKYLESRELKKTPPMLQMDSIAMLSMTPDQLKVFMNGLSTMQKNIPQNVDNSRMDTTNESENESTMTEKESMLMYGIGLLFAAFAVIMFCKWFFSTAGGRLTKAGFNAVAGHLQGELEDLVEKMKYEQDEEKLRDYQKEEIRIRRKMDKNRT